MPHIAAEHEHEHSDTFSLSGIRCAAHTLQLVVKYALAALPEETKNVIKLCRRIAKILRLESTKYFIEGTGLILKKPKVGRGDKMGLNLCYGTFFLLPSTNISKIK